jgi:hypothetical protein
MRALFEHERALACGTLVGNLIKGVIAFFGDKGEHFFYLLLERSLVEESSKIRQSHHRLPT